MLSQCVNPDIFSRASAFSAHLDLNEDLGSRSSELIGRALPETLTSAHPRRRAEYVAGRYCAREALVLAKGGTGVRAAEIRVRVEAPSEEGRLPVWPEGFVGSITHKGGYVSAAVARDRVLRGIGIDSERELADAEALKLRDSIATERERELVRTLAEAEASRGFAARGPGLLYTILFSAKESLYKALFPEVRVFFGFHDAELVSLAEGAFRLKLLRGLGQAYPRGWECEGRFAQLDARVHTAIEVAY
jgi:enterobactin synthetase component D